MSEKSVVQVKLGEWAQFDDANRFEPDEAGEVVFCEGGIVVIRFDDGCCWGAPEHQIVMNWPDREAFLADFKR